MDMLLRPKPGPSSKTVALVEEVVSPQVKAAASMSTNQSNLKALIVQPAGNSTTAIPDPLAN